MNETEERTVGIPQSITINGVTYAVKDTPELQKFIQEVAKVEKSKLRTQFENLKTQIANLGSVQVTGGELDIDSVVNRMKDTFVTKEDFKSMLPNMIKEVVQPVLTATEQNRQDELKQYREKLINENIATCIPELVKGETKEELDRSLQESIRLRAAYPTPSTSYIDPTKHVEDPLIKTQMQQYGENPETTPTPQGNSPAPQSTETTTPSAPPAAPRRPSPEVSGPTNVKKMSMDEFSKQRENLMTQLRATYEDNSF